MSLSDMFLARKLKMYQLTVFQQVVHEKSMAHAARSLNMTQPAISKVLRELENHFGAPLLIRGNRGVVTTELGELVVRRTAPLLRELRSLSSEASNFLSGKSGNVAIGSLISASKSLLPGAIRLLKQANPDIEVTLKIGEMTHLLPALSVGDLDLVVSRVPDGWQSRKEFQDLSVDVLYEETFSLVAGCDHPLHACNQPSLAEMHHLPWVLPTRESLFRRTVDRLFSQAGLGPPANIVESLSILSNLSLLADQRTLCFMPTETAQQFNGTGLLSIIDFKTDKQFGTIGCFFPANATLRPAAQRFRDCLTRISGGLQSPDGSPPKQVTEI